MNGDAFWREREENKKKKKKEREQRFYLSTGRVSILSTRRDTLKILLLFIGPSWFISRTPRFHYSPSPSSSTVWATSVGMLPTELNSRWLASGKLSVYTEKTCETENVAPMNEASPLLPTGNALMDPKSFDRSLFSFPLGESGEIFMHLVRREYAR